MKTLRTMCLPQLLCLFVIISFSLNLSASIQTKNEENLEVIDVVGEKPLKYYRDQMKLAESNFYDMYNDLVDIKKFKINCRKEKPTGSHIKRKVCYPQYVLNEFAKITQQALIPKSQDARGLVEPFPTITGINESVSDTRNKSNDYMKKLLIDNPDLYRQYLALRKSVEMYKQKKESN